VRGATVANAAAAAAAVREGSLQRKGNLERKRAGRWKAPPPPSTTSRDVCSLALARARTFGKRSIHLSRRLAGVGGAGSAALASARRRGTASVGWGGGESRLACVVVETRSLERCPTCFARGKGMYNYSIIFCRRSRRGKTADVVTADVADFFHRRENSRPPHPITFLSLQASGNSTHRSAGPRPSEGHQEQIGRDAGAASVGNPLFGFEVS